MDTEQEEELTSVVPSHCQVSKQTLNHLTRKPVEINPSLCFFYLQVTELHNSVYL